MSLPQLIGLKCATCQKGIGSVLEGMFCEDCGNPVHRTCVGKAGQSAADRCPNCGGAPDSDTAKEVRGVWNAEARLRALGKACPFCGSGDVASLPPPVFFTYTNDRFCNRCRTQWAPPTPLSAAVIIIVLGVIFLLVGIGGAGFLIAKIGETSIPFKAFSGVAFSTALGTAMVGFGIRSLSKLKKRCPPTNDGD